jgi:hypothetical protein
MLYRSIKTKIMKKLLLIAFLLASVSAFSQVKIELPVTVNGIPAVFTANYPKTAVNVDSTVWRLINKDTTILNYKFKDTTILRITYKDTIITLPPVTNDNKL